MYPMMMYGKGGFITVLSAEEEEQKKREGYFNSVAELKAGKHKIPPKPLEAKEEKPRRGRRARK